MSVVDTDSLLSDMLQDAAETLISLESVSVSLQPALDTPPVASTSTLEAATGRPRSHSLRRRSLEEFRAPQLRQRGKGREDAEDAQGVPGLLRRCSSVEGLDEGEDDSNDDFSSEDEAFRGPKRPPSIVSSISSGRIGIQVEDNSQLQQAVFTRDVRIRNFFAVGEDASRSYIVYDCQITTKEGVSIRLLKRFSEFVALRGALLESFPSLRSIIPRLPARSSLGVSHPVMSQSTIADEYWRGSKVPTVLSGEASSKLVVLAYDGAAAS